jgi:hypothetical protein
MLKEILTVSGKSGLYKLVSKKDNMVIIESLVDRKRLPLYARDAVISLGDISIYTLEGDISIGEVFTAIREKEKGEKVSLDLVKAQPDDLRTYFAEILPNFVRERVYPSDIKKLLKWYEILISNHMTDFSKKDDATDPEKKESAAATVADDQKEPRKASKTTAVKITKRRDDTNSITSTKTTKAKPTSSIPKKSIVGAKRGG